MATITFDINAQTIGAPQEGKIGSTVIREDTCDSVWKVSVIAAITAWVEWTTVGDGWTVAKIGGGTINGEQLNDDLFEYMVTVENYQSPNNYQNDEYSSITFYLKDSDGGTLLDRKTFARHHTGQYCTNNP
jgi:hypothetical protein